MEQNNIGNNTKVIKKANVSSKYIMLRYCNAIAGAVLTVYLFVMYNGIDNFEIMKLLLQGYRKSDIDKLRGIFLFLIIVLAVVTIFEFLQTIVIKKSFICICEDKVYGLGGKSYFLTEEPFEVTYDRIINVKKKGNPFKGRKLVLECREGTYSCYVENMDEIISIIKGKINRI